MQSSLDRAQDGLAQISRALPARWPPLTLASLRGDAMAGWLGALLLVPQSVAFSTLAGLPPSFGLVTAVVPCIVAALAGSSWHVVTGPSNALSMAMLGMLLPLAQVGSDAYLALAATVTLCVGIIQWVTGRLRLGALANFISPSALLGFTTGVAVLIMLHAMQAVLGQGEDTSPHGARIWQLVWQLLQGIWHSQPAPLLVASAAIAAAWLWGRWRQRGEPLLVALAGGAAAGALVNWGAQYPRLTGLGRVELLEPLAWTLPVWQLPHLPADRLPELMGAAASLALVALAQNVGLARMLAERSGQHLDLNREIAGQGLANAASACFGGYVACGSFSRSVPSMDAGAQSPLAAVLVALVFVALMLFGAPLLAWVPAAAIGAVLVLVGIKLLEPAAWRALWRASRAEFGIAATTLVATLLLRLEVAVVLGSAMSLGLYLHRSSLPPMPTVGFDRSHMPRRFVVTDDNPAALPECPQLKMMRMGDSVFFGAAAHVQDHLQRLRDTFPDQRHLLVLATSMNRLDVAGSRVWKHELLRRRAGGGDLYFYRPREVVLHDWRRDGFLDMLGEGHVFQNKRGAIATVVARLDGDVCARCTVRAFSECAQQPGPPTTPRAGPLPEQTQ